MNHSSRGQVLLILTLFIGVSVAVGIAIAGSLTVAQIRQARGIANSTKAIFAADAGLEWGLCAIIHPHPGTFVCRGGPQGGLNPDPQSCPASEPTFGNGAAVEVDVDCRGQLPERIVATGYVGDTVRVLELGFFGPQP